MKVSVVWSARSGLTLVCLQFALLTNGAGAVADTRIVAGNPNSQRSETGRYRICNPAPDATMEDLRLAEALLQDTTEMRNWRTVAWYLGELGFREGFEPLRDFVWGAHVHSDPMLYMLDALSSAQTSIGHLAVSCPEATHYLIQSTNPEFWRSLPWGESRTTGPEIWLAMSEASIKALGISGVPEAGQMLARLRRWPYKEAQRVTIEEAIHTFHWVTLGRRYWPAYLRELSRFHLPEILAPTSDRVSLLGAWRWMRSAGPWGGYQTPPACGWSRTLFFEQDSTYSFWEEDSIGVYRVCGGRFILHPFEGGSKEPRLELQWWAWQGPGTFTLSFMGRDLLALRPVGAADAYSTHTFAREGEDVVPPDTVDAIEWRPPRVCRSTPTSYYIEVPTTLYRPLASVWVQQWNLSYSKALVPKGYEYTHNQIPSGVIGDFDGDSLADAAIYGYDSDDRNTVACLLSNRGSPRGAAAWRDSAAARREDRGARPSCYLELCPSGESVTDSKGTTVVLAADGIYTTSANGERWILYYTNGEFHRGRPVRVGGSR